MREREKEGEQLERLVASGLQSINNLVFSLFLSDSHTAVILVFAGLNFKLLYFSIGRKLCVLSGLYHVARNQHRKKKESVSYMFLAAIVDRKPIKSRVIRKETKTREVNAIPFSAFFNQI